MEADLLRQFLHRTRKWSRAQRSLQVFSMAAKALSEFAEADSGFFVYQHQFTVDEQELKPTVYTPWGMFQDLHPDLQDLVDTSVTNIQKWDHCMERWLLTKDISIPLVSNFPAVRPLLELGVWPVTSRDRIVGAIVVARTRPASGRMTLQTGTAILDACAAQVSVALDFIQALHFAQEASQRDLLTGLLNRRGLEQRLPQIIQEAKKWNRCVIFAILDVDNLKDINDSHGHPAGDKLLRRLADTIKTSIRQEDLACRYGGDEFVVVIQSTENNIKAVKRVEAKIEASGCHVSLGAALWHTDGNTLEQCYKMADKRLYEAKKQRGTV